MHFRHVSKQKKNETKTKKDRKSKWIERQQKRSAGNSVEVALSLRRKMKIGGGNDDLSAHFDCNDEMAASFASSAGGCWSSSSSCSYLSLVRRHRLRSRRSRLHRTKAIHSTSFAANLCFHESLATSGLNVSLCFRRSPTSSLLYFRMSVNPFH